MAEANLMHAWDHTARLHAVIHNANCSKAGDKIRDPSTLNPVRMALSKRRQPEPDPEDDAQALIAAFVPTQ